MSDKKGAENSEFIFKLFLMFVRSGMFLMYV